MKRGFNKNIAILAIIAAIVVIGGIYLATANKAKIPNNNVVDNTTVGQNAQQSEESSTNDLTGRIKIVERLNGKITFEDPATGCTVWVFKSDNANFIDYLGSGINIIKNSTDYVIGIFPDKKLYKGALYLSDKKIMIVPMCGKEDEVEYYFKLNATLVNLLQG